LKTLNLTFLGSLFVGDIKKARDAGFFTVDKLMMEPKKVRYFSQLLFLIFLERFSSSSNARPVSSPAESFLLSLSFLQVLCDIKGLSEAKIDKMLEAANKMCSRAMFQTALELDEAYKREIGKKSFLCLPLLYTNSSLVSYSFTYFTLQCASLLALLLWTTFSVAG